MQIALTSLHNLLLDYSWIKKKLERTSSHQLITEYLRLKKDPALNSIYKALRLSTQAIVLEPDELGEQLSNRLAHFNEPDVKKLKEKHSSVNSTSPICMQLIPYSPRPEFCPLIFHVIILPQYPY